MAERQAAGPETGTADDAGGDVTVDETAGAPGSDDGGELYVVYWIDEEGYEGSCEFLQAGSEDAARELSSYASGGTAHQRLLFAGTFEDFREYVEEELEDVDRFDLVWG